MVLAATALSVERNDLHHCTGAGISLQVTRSVTLTNNLIHQNGVGIAVHSDAPVYLMHNTLAYNTSAGLTISAPTSHITMTNSIAWENGITISHTVGASVTASYSDIQGGWPGQGNIDVDPQFRHPGAGVFRLLETSPCIDTASPSSTPPVDIMGIPRPEGDGYDMGAFEFFEYYSVYLPFVANKH